MREHKAEFQGANDPMTVTMRRADMEAIVQTVLRNYTTVREGRMFPAAMIEDLEGMIKDLRAQVPECFPATYSYDR